MRLPTVSALGLSRSCGRVSQAGNSTTMACGAMLASASRSDSESRPVATMASRARGGRLAREEAGDERRAKPVHDGEVGASVGLGERLVERAGARERRDQALEYHRISLL